MVCATAIMSAAPGRDSLAGRSLGVSRPEAGGGGDGGGTVVARLVHLVRRAWRRRHANLCIQIMIMIMMIIIIIGGDGSGGAAAAIERAGRPSAARASRTSWPSDEAAEEIARNHYVRRSFDGQNTGRVLGSAAPARPSICRPSFR